MPVTFTQEQLDAVRVATRRHVLDIDRADRIVVDLGEPSKLHGVAIEGVLQTSADQITPWDLFAAASLLRTWTVGGAARDADRMMAERAKRMEKVDG